MTLKNSRKRSNQKTMDYPSRAYVAEPFFSIAMNCWKIEYIEIHPPKDFREQKESSICCENNVDAISIFRVLQSVTTWEQWINASDMIRAEMLKGSGNRVWRVGVRGMACDLFHKQTA